MNPKSERAGVRWLRRPSLILATFLAGAPGVLGASPTSPASPASPTSAWPQFLGPTRNAVYTGAPLADQWPDAGPTVVWRSAVGEGYASPSVSDGRLVVAHRTGNELLVNCYELLTGRTNWSSRFPMKFRDGEGGDSGPRATPAIHDGRVFLCNTDGLIACLDLGTGRTVWSRKAKAEFKSDATWHGFVSSPLVVGRAVILSVGGTNSAGVVAFERSTGEILWKVLNEKASAASPVLATVGGKSQLIVITRTGLHSLNPETGSNYWRLPTRRQSSGNLYAASPVLFEDYLFIAGGYGLGAQLLQFENEIALPKKRWHLDDALSTHFANAIHLGGFLYGFHGHPGLPEGRTFRCVAVASGKVMWEQTLVASGTVTQAGENLIILQDNGELMLARATSSGLQIKSHAQIVGRPTRSYPALVDGYAFLKGPKELVCLDLRAPARARPSP
jgi:outer membrane protein assembly factor BamB